MHRSPTFTGVRYVLTYLSRFQIQNTLQSSCGGGGDGRALSLYGPGRAKAEILAMVCGKIGTYRFLMLFLVLLNPQLCKYVDSTEITSVR
jgi:hypothetical protein